MSIYIHIPFCKQICSYCAFCKMIYNEKFVNGYLGALKEEVKKYYKNEVIDTIYIGGGTPSSLNIEALKKLFEITNKFKLSDKLEFTFECNIGDLNKEVLLLLYKNKVNRLSIGIQTFNQEHLFLLNRNHSYKEVQEKILLAKKIGFKNISIDLIYGLPNQTEEELKKDLKLFLSLDIKHISAYSLMIEKNTVLYNKGVTEIDQDKDCKFYQIIVNTLEKHDFIRYEISNFAKKDYESKHNTNYWMNKEYYGFGLSACGYLKNIRYENTRSLISYINNKFRYSEEIIIKNDKIIYEIILGLRMTSGISKKNFFNKYGIILEENAIIKNLIDEHKILENQDNIFINPEYIYTSNEILLRFVGENYE